MVCLDSVMNKVTDRHAESVNLVSSIVNLVSHIVASLLQLVHKAPNLCDTLQHWLPLSLKSPRKCNMIRRFIWWYVFFFFAKKSFWSTLIFYRIFSVCQDIPLYDSRGSSKGEDGGKCRQDKEKVGQHYSSAKVLHLTSSWDSDQDSLSLEAGRG